MSSFLLIQVRLEEVVENSLEEGLTDTAASLRHMPHIPGGDRQGGILREGPSPAPALSTCSQEGGRRGKTEQVYQSQSALCI